MSVDGVDGSWILRSNRSASVVDAAHERVASTVLEANHFYEIVLEESGETLLLRTEPSTEDRRCFLKYLLPTKATIRIGRGEDCDIRFSSKFVSAKHAELEVTQQQVRLRDAGSANGTFVNGQRAQSLALSPGDVILIVGLKIVIGRGFIAINNPDGLVSCDEAVLRSMARQDIEPVEDDAEDSVSWYAYHRSPRTKTDIVPFDLRIDPPPSKDATEEMPTLMLVGPALTMGMSSMLMGAFSLMTALKPGGGGFASAMPTMLMSFTMVGGMILWPVLSKRHERRGKVRREEERRVKYGEYLDAARAAIAGEQAKQTNLLRGNAVTTAQCVARALHREPGLWERTPEHDDFVSVRLGTGDVPMWVDAPPVERRFSIEKDDLSECYFDLVDTPAMLADVPITVPLGQHPVVGVVGERESVTGLARDLVLQLATLQSYEELKLVFIYGEAEAAKWEFARWLPHVWSSDGSARYAASTSAEAKELSAYLDHEVNARVQRNHEGDAAAALPYVVIIALDSQVAARVEAVNRVIRERVPGFTVITAYDEYQSLPKECRAVIEVGGVGWYYDPLDITGHRTRFIPDERVTVDMRAVARALANTKVEARASHKVLPEALTFLDMMAAGRVEHLNAPARWRDNNPVLSLEAPLGVSSDGEVFKLDIHERYHGPHGLIAGMTGSGKSELIMTYILSLALNYSPHELAFVLIDYKGGGMANAFADLPHVAGTITNLDGAAVTRSLVSLQSELKRRQALFNHAAETTGTSNIDIYKYQSLYREGAVTEPLPHLLVISDEFAELKAQQPDFMDQLVSAARIGRSLGVHLILATQKPSGVVDDQIWSNSRFRICLKVQENADSMEVIKRSDAAALTTTGRFYVQVGSNELFDIGQSAWSGAPYHPAERAGTGYDDSVVLLGRLGQSLRQARPQAPGPVGGRAPKQLDAIVSYITKLAHDEGVQARPLWLEPIPGVIRLSDVQSGHGYSYDRARLQALVGTYDDPEQQKQGPMTVDFTADGNLILYGAAGSGKTTFIATLLFALITGYTPEDVSIYVLDFAAETLRAFQSAPHVGDVLFSPDAERIGGLFHMLRSEIVRRRGLLAGTGGDFANYRASGGRQIGAMLVVVHNYAAFSELYEDYEDDLSFLTREGTKYGVYFVLTAATSTSVRYRVQQNFRQLAVLQMNDPSEYGGILGNTGGIVPSKLPGRGLFRADSVYEFQTATVSTDDEGVFARIRKACSSLADDWTGANAARIPILPERVTSDYLRDEITSAADGRLPVGVSKDSLSVVHHDFASHFVTLVLSQAEERLSFMAGVVEALLVQASGKITVLDPAGLLGDALKTAASAHLSVESDSPAVVTAVGDLFREMLSRFKSTKPSPETAEGTRSRDYFIIPSLSELRSSLSTEGEADFFEMLERCDASLGVSFIVGDCSGALASITYEGWAKRHVDSGTGIFVGDGFMDQFVLQSSVSSAGHYKPIGRSFGYVLSRGRATLVKMLTSEYGAVGSDE